MGQNNTSKDGAWEVTKDASSAYTSGAVDNTGYTRHAQGDAYGTSFFRHAWWVYHPTANGTANITGVQSVAGNGSTNLYITIFKQATDGSLTPNNLIGATGSHTHPVVAGETWFYVFSQNNDTVTSTYWLTMQTSSPATLAPAHDSRVNPQNVIIVATGNTFEAQPTPAAQLTYNTATNEDGALYPNTFRSAWWKYVPEVAGSLSATARRVGGSNPIYLSIYEDPGSGVTRIAAPVVQQATSTVSVVTGRTYYLTINEQTASDASPTYRMTIAAPKSASYDPDTTNHQWTNAITIVPDAAGHYSADVNNTLSRFADAESNPTTATLPGFRAAWYKFSPLATRAGVDAATYGSIGNIFMQVFSRLNGVFTQIGYETRGNTSYTNSVIFTVTVGTDYYFRIGNLVNDAGQTMHLGIDYLPTKAAVLYSAPPIRVTVQGQKPTLTAQRTPVPPIAVTADVREPKLTGGNGRVRAVPIAVAVTMQPLYIEVFADEVFVPAINLAVMMGNPSAIEAGLTLTSPDAGETIATHYPQFIVALTADDPEVDYQIEIQYAQDNAFTDPVSVLVDAPAVDGGITYTPTTAVFDATFWRARLLLDGDEVIGWTMYRVFYVSADIAAVELEVTWNVQTGAARPIHLWHFDPPGVEEGELVTVYGQGFPLSTGTLYLYNEPVLPLSWDLVPADSAATPVTRVIDGELVDPEHFAVTFIAPPVEEPGGPLTVEA